MDVEAVLALAPDRQVAVGANKLAEPTGWRELGQDGSALWGLCRGSGQSPYQVCVDLLDRSTKCSCPSRKFPCKHAVALQLLHARSAATDAEQPEWVDEWLRNRRSKKAPAQRRAAPSKQREDAVQGGVAGLKDWLADVADGGLAALPGKESQWWQGIIARMIDAQAPGLAAAITELRSVVAANRPRWYEEATDHIGRLHLLAQVTAGELTAVVRTRLGFTVHEEDVRSGAGWSDDWVVLLRSDSDDGRVRTVRQWVWGRARREWVVAVRHAFGGATPAPALTAGAELTAVFHPYPGGQPRRIAVGEVTRTRPAGPIPLPDNWMAALSGVEPLLLSDPWQRLVPLGCRAVRPAKAGQQVVLVDAAERALPARWGSALAQALARGGGAPFDAMCLWDGSSVQLCAVAEPGGRPEVLV